MVYNEVLLYMLVELNLVTVTAAGGDTVSTIGGKIVTAYWLPLLLWNTVLTSANVAGLVTLTQVGSADYAIKDISATLTAGFVASVGSWICPTNGSHWSTESAFYHVVSTDRHFNHTSLTYPAYIAATRYTMSYATSVADVYTTEMSCNPTLIGLSSVQTSW